MKTHSTTTRAGLMLGALALVAGVLGGCRGDREDKPPRQFFPDLDDQPKWHPQAGSEFFADGRTMRQPPAGSVPFGRVGFVSEEPWAEHHMAQRDDLLREDAAYYEGVGADGQYLDRIPAPVTLDMVKRGQERFNIYCSACHGFMADGKGLVGVQFNPIAANLHDEKYKVKPKDPNEPRKDVDGYIFHTIRYGVRNAQGVSTMPSYAHAVNEHDAWAIVAYIRALQATREGKLEDVPEKERQTIEREWGRVSNAGGSPAPGSAAGTGGDN